MKWTITRLKKFIKKGGVVKVIRGESPPDQTTYITRHSLRNLGTRFQKLKRIDASNIDSLSADYYAKWAVYRIHPNYYTSTYYLNMKNYEEMKADALDSKNDD